MVEPFNARCRKTVCNVQNNSWSHLKPRSPREATLPSPCHKGCVQIHRLGPEKAAFSATWCHFHRDLIICGVEIQKKPFLNSPGFMWSTEATWAAAFEGAKGPSLAKCLSRIWKPRVVESRQKWCTKTWPLEAAASEFGHSQCVTPQAELDSISKCAKDWEGHGMRKGHSQTTTWLKSPTVTCESIWPKQGDHWLEMQFITLDELQVPVAKVGESPHYWPHIAPFWHVWKSNKMKAISQRNPSPPKKASLKFAICHLREIPNVEEGVLVSQYLTWWSFIHTLIGRAMWRGASSCW